MVLSSSSSSSSLLLSRGLRMRSRWRRRQRQRWMLSCGQEKVSAALSERWDSLSLVPPRPGRQQMTSRHKLLGESPSRYPISAQDTDARTHTHTRKNRRSAGRCEGGVDRLRLGGFSGSQGSSQRDRIASTGRFSARAQQSRSRTASGSARRRWSVSMVAQTSAAGGLDGGRV